MAKDQSQIKASQNSTKTSTGIIIALLILLGFIIWLTILWHNNGIHQEIFGWSGTNKVFLAVLYNLVLMVTTGILLGILMGKLNDIISKGSRKNKLFDKGLQR